MMKVMKNMLPVRVSVKNHQFYFYTSNHTIPSLTHHTIIELQTSLIHDIRIIRPKAKNKHGVIHS